MSELRLFAACLPGLEPFLADELRALGADGKELAGGVAFAGDRGLLLAAHLRLGVASHLLLRCATFRCRSLGELRRKTAGLPWAEWLRADAPFAVRATARKSRLWHTGAIEQRVREGIADALGGGVQARADDPAPGAIAVPVAARFLDDECELSIDTSATPLWRRGYRLATAKAPLREDLARALLLAARWQGETALLDPCCGSGTIAIEAALLAAGLPPGRLRPPPLTGTALADDARWHALVTAATPRAAVAPIRASDRDPGAIDAARGNAERAGVADRIAFDVAAFSAAAWLAAPHAAPQQGLLATNPPYAVRVAKGRDPGALFQALGHRLQALGPGWRAALIAQDVRAARRLGAPLQVAFATRHGGLRVAALCSPDPA